MKGGVLWITHHWPPRLSTCANLARAFAEHLALAGPPVWVMTPPIPDLTESAVLGVVATPEDARPSLWRRATALTKGDARWFHAPLAQGGEIITRENCRVVVASSGAKPVCFEVAALLARRHGVALVLDYRDPWTQNEAITFSNWKYLKKAPKLWLARQRERRALAAAALVLVRSAGMKEEMLAAFGDVLTKDRVMVIPNAVDDRLLSAGHPPSPTPADGPLSVLFKGSGTGREAMLKTLHEGLMAFAANTGRPVAFTLIGMGQELAGERGGVTVSTFAGIPLEELVQTLHRQDMLITLLPENYTGCETGTLWLYVATGKPILAMVPPQGDEANGARQAPVHAVLPPRATAGQVAQALAQLAQHPPPPAWAAPPNALASTHMKRLLERLTGMGIL